MKFRRTLVRLGISVIILIIAYFLFRNTFLHWAFSRVQLKAEQNYHLHIISADIRFSGFDVVHFKKLQIQQPGTGTTLIINDLDCNLSFSDLLTGKIGFDKIRTIGSTLNIQKPSDQSNLNIPSQNKIQPNDKVSYLNYLETANSWKEKFFRVLGTALYIREMHILYTDSAHSENIYLRSLKYDLHKFSALVINQNSEDSILFTGNVLKKNSSFQLSIHTNNKLHAYFPFLDRDHSFKCRFQTVNSSLTINEINKNLEIQVMLEAEDLVLNHWRLGKGDVTFPKAEINTRWFISDNGIELDSNSIFRIQGVPFKLIAKYSSKPDASLGLQIHMPEIMSDSAFAALPDGIFRSLNGISCSGTLAFDLQFNINALQPDSLYFYTSLSRKNFRLNHFGAENYARINAPFIYNAFDKDKFVRQIFVGPDNQMFTPLNSMSDYLPKAVLQSEDPSFMQHRGFLPEAFRESIIQNFKEKRFARGGSTISMQLVKNIFLSRDKTISRKAEEALIVYLIENLGLVPKERMLEIYLNIIEWGPNVYGIGEASRFYFNKRPSELSLQESIFLASLIPAPKYFRYRFDKQGNLNPNMYGYFRILISRMAGKGWISSVDTAGFHPEIKLRGPARNFISASDNIRIEEDGDF